jgi:transcriptional regulator with XRE-family HTH domain
MLGMDEAALSKIVNGYREPGAALRKSIAGLLQSDEAWLFVRDERAAAPFPHEDGKAASNS